MKFPSQLHHGRRAGRFPWAVLLPVAALAVYAAPAAWHREWRLAVAGAWRTLTDAADRSPPSDPSAAADERATLLLAERARLLDEAAELRAIAESYEIARKTWPNRRLIPAALVPAETADPDGGLLDRGADDGVVRGDAVAQGDALLGVVTRTGPKTSWIRYVSSPSSRLPARAVPPDPGAAGAGAARELCLVAGQGRDQAAAWFYAFETPADKEWLLVSARTPDYPLADGILIGRLRARPAAADENGVRAAALSLPAAALRGLRVTVVKDVQR